MFTDEVFTKFRAMGDTHAKYDRPTTAGSRSELISENIVLESSPLHFTYSSFSLIQCLLVLVSTQMHSTQKPSVFSFHQIVISPAISVSFLSSMSLTLFFLSRNENLETGFYRSSVLIFVLNSVVLSSNLIGEQIVSAGIGSASGKISVIGVTFSIAWALLGIYTLAKQNRGKLCLIVT